MPGIDHYFELQPVGHVVVVRAGSHELARSRRAVRLLEFNRGQAMPPVIYLPREDVPVQSWEKSGLTTGCPIKGKCEYWSIDVGGQRYANAVWSYTDVTKAGESIKNWVAFDQARLTVDVGGSTTR